MLARSQCSRRAVWVTAYAKMGWTFGETYDPEAKTHPDMVPYDQLGQREQDKDSVFVALL